MSDRIIKLKLISNKEIMDLRPVKAEELKFKMGDVIDTGGTKNYNTLINKPSINGVELIGNYDEIDPTVPDWAKNENKPDYTAPEVGAVDRNNAMTFVDIKKAWDTFFK